MMNMCDTCIGNERGRIQATAEAESVKQKATPSHSSILDKLLHWKELDRYERASLKRHINSLVTVAVILGVPAILLYSCMTAEPKEMLPQTDDATAVVECQNAITLQATYGSKADFSMWSDVKRYGSLTEVIGSVEFMNGFGVMLPYEYRCMFKINALVSADVNPR